MAPKTRAKAKAKLEKSVTKSKHLLASKNTKRSECLPEASPASIPVPAVEIKRGRGRPRKYPRPEDQPSATDVKQKRGRGRPPKYLKAAAATVLPPRPILPSTDSNDQLLLPNPSRKVPDSQDDVGSSPSTSSGFTSPREVSSSMSPLQNKTSDAGTDGQKNGESGEKAIKLVQGTRPAAKEIHRDIAHDFQCLAPTDRPGELLGEPLRKQPRQEPPQKILRAAVPVSCSSKHCFPEDHDYFGQKAYQDVKSMKAEKDHLRDLMTQLMPERKTFRPRQDIREEADRILKEIQEKEKLGISESPEIPPEVHDGPQLYEEMIAQGNTVHTVIKTSTEQEKALQHFFKEMKSICLRDIHTIATITELPAKFVTIWLQNNAQNPGLMNTEDDAPIQLDIQPLITQQNSSSRQEPNREREQVNQHEGDEYHGRDGSSPGPSTQRERSTTTEAQRVPDLIQDNSGTSGSSQVKREASLEDQKPATWLPTKFSANGISLEAVMNSHLYPMPPDDTESDKWDRIMNSVVRNCQIHGAPTTPPRWIPKEQRTMQTETVPQNLVNFHPQQVSIENGLLHDNNRYQNHQNQSILQADGLHHNHNSFNPLRDAVVNQNWRPVPNNIPPPPPKILPESGQLFLPTTAMLDIDKWTVDEVVQWSEHFMKPDSRKDLRRNGVNGFALRLLFLEDNKYWLSTGMSIGDIERLKLHTAKVINTSNGY